MSPSIKKEHREDETPKPLDTPELPAIEQKSSQESPFNPIDLTPLGPADKDNIAYILNIIGSNCKKNKVLVIGDVMLDYKMYCSETGPLQSQKHNVNEDFSFTRAPESKMLGGAAHVAYACSVFSDVTLFGVIGNDSQGTDLEEETIKLLGSENTKYHRVDGFYTTTKMYFECTLKTKQSMNNPDSSDHDKPKKIIRINREYDEATGEKLLFDEEDALVKKFSEYIHSVNCIIFKDHQKGFLSQRYLDLIIGEVNKKIHPDKPFFVFIDPKYKWDKFFGLAKVDAIIPNIKEAAAGIYPGNTKEIAKREEASALQKEDWQRLNEVSRRAKCIVVTADKMGAFLYLKDKIQEDLIIPTLFSVPIIPPDEGHQQSEIGCGDVFDAYFIACMINQEELKKKFSPQEIYEYSLRLANFAAGLKMSELASEIITLRDIRKELGITGM